MDLRSSVKHVSVLADHVREPATGITVLVYHRVGGDSSSEVDLPLDDFVRQLDHLAAHHRVLSLGEASKELAALGPAEPGVVLTFDDGTADFVEHAVPALIEAGLPATLYVATQFIHDGADFPWDAPPASWAGLRDASSSELITIGSHTHTHALLDRADPDLIAGELDRSIELIGEHIGEPPEHFAYPKALPGSREAEDEVRSRFNTAALARSRVNVPGRTDLHRLSRTPIQHSDGFEFFTKKAAGGMRLEGELRDLAARLRYRRATN